MLTGTNSWHSYPCKAEDKHISIGYTSVPLFPHLNMLRDRVIDDLSISANAVEFDLPGDQNRDGYMSVAGTTYQAEEVVERLTPPMHILQCVFFGQPCSLHACFAAANVNCFVHQCFWFPNSDDRFQARTALKVRTGRVITSLCVLLWP